MAKSTTPSSSSLSSSAKGGKKRSRGGNSSVKKNSAAASSTAAKTRRSGAAASRRSTKKGDKAEEEEESSGRSMDDERNSNSSNSSSSSEEEEYNPKPRTRTRSSKKKLDFSYEDASSFDDDDLEEEAKNDDDDDSSYSEDDISVKHNAKDEEDDDDSSAASSTSPNNNNTNNNTRRSYSPSTILNARVKIISGQYKGKKGTVIDANRGWYTLDQRSGVLSAVRARELQVMRYATNVDHVVRKNTTKQEEEMEEDQVATTDDDDDDDVQFVNNGYEVSSTTHGDLTGATVRINSGKFMGLTGMINERRSFMHVQIDNVNEDDDPPIEPLHVSDVTIIRHPNRNAYMDDDIFLPITTPSDAATAGATSTSTTVVNTDQERLDMISKKYVGSKIKVLPHHVNAGTIGTVVKVLVGDWYITNNPLISNAYNEKSK